MLETSFAGLKMRNPTVLASGFLGTTAGLMARVIEEGGAGAVTTKSIGPVEKDAYPNPTVLEWEHGLINAVGLPTPGYKGMEKELAELQECKIPAIASIYGNTVEQYAEIAEFAARFRPGMIELNMSCPHSKGQGQPFGMGCEIAKEVVSAVKKAAGGIPIMPKLTPQAENIAAVAKACEGAGADAICAINTLGPGMLINAEARKPVLANKFGGLSGPAVKPIALRCVYQIYEAVKVPILGMGGVTTGRDAIEMAMAGATAIGVGSAFYYRGFGACKKICAEMEEWMRKNKVKSLEEIRGAAHD